MKSYIVELIGTFFLVLVIGLTVIEPGAGSLAPLAIGAALMVMVYAGGHISGAHYNPAITLAVWMRGKCDTKDVLPYMILQVVGGVLAAIVVGFSRNAARTASMSLKGTQIVSPANSAGTPALSGRPWVRAPLPAWTSNASTCPW